MPLMDGIEATRRLKIMMEGKEIDEIPIIGLSAHYSKFEKNTKYCMDHLIEKPIRMELLKDTLEKYIK